MLVALFLCDNPAVAQNSLWPNATFFTVVARPGDTLSGVAARYAVSANAVARLNALDRGSEIFAGEILRVPAQSLATRDAVFEEALDRDARNYAPPARSFDTGGDDPPMAGVRDPAPVSFHISSRSARMRPDVSQDSRSRVVTLRFAWPVAGSVISQFGVAQNGERNDGINIAAKLGDPIRAAAAGTVTYASNGLRDYGNLILIEHADGYVTAYAHAESITVGPGEHVTKGQVIGTAGETGEVDRPQLHFEIRRGVKPVNPRLFLASNP